MVNEDVFICRLLSKYEKRASTTRLRSPTRHAEGRARSMHVSVPPLQLGPHIPLAWALSFPMKVGHTSHDSPITSALFCHHSPPLVATIMFLLPVPILLEPIRVLISRPRNRRRQVIGLFKARPSPHICQHDQGQSLPFSSL